MKILYCEINETPVTVVLDSGANCNIIGKSLVDELGLEIDYPHIESEKSPHILGLPILGMFHEINPSFQSKDNKSKQVKVTDIFVTNKPELEYILILGQPWFQENAMKLDFPNKTLTLLDGTDIQLVIGPKIPPPTQLNRSVDDYFKMIKVYAIALDIELDNQYLKRTFFNGLSRDNKKEVIRFGFKKSLSEIVNHLNRISSGYTDFQNFQFGNLRQEESSIMDFYMKVKKYCKLAGCNEDHLKHQFIRGLSPENQIETRRCGLDLPLEELVERLSGIENVRKIQNDIWSNSHPPLPIPIYTGTLLDETDIISAFSNCIREIEGKIPVKALIDTSSKFNTISKSLFDKLGEDYGLGCLSDDELIGKEIKCLDLQFHYKGKWRSLDCTELIDFQICKNPSVDLILGQEWLWMREAKISFEHSPKTYVHHAKIVIDGMSIPLIEENSNKDNSGLAQEEFMNIINKILSGAQDIKHQKSHHGIFRNIPLVPPTPRRLDDDASKNSGAGKIKKYPKVDLGDGSGNLSIKTHLNNIWRLVHSIENDIEYRIFEKLCIIEYELSCINKAKLPWIKSETETNSSSSDSESTGSDWCDLDPIKP
nr:4440_t:CDS:2 [Entrophospora candida]